MLAHSIEEYVVLTELTKNEGRGKSFTVNKPIYVRWFWAGSYSFSQQRDAYLWAEARCWYSSARPIGNYLRAAVFLNNRTVLLDVPFVSVILRACNQHERRRTNDFFFSFALSLQSCPPSLPHCHRWTRHNLTSIVFAIPDSLLCFCLLWENKCVTIWVVSKKLLSFIWRSFLTYFRLGKRRRASLLRISRYCVSVWYRDKTQRRTAELVGFGDPPALTQMNVVSLAGVSSYINLQACLIQSASCIWLGTPQFDYHNCTF